MALGVGKGLGSLFRDYHLSAAEENGSEGESVGEGKSKTRTNLPAEICCLCLVC